MNRKVIRVALLVAVMALLLLTVASVPATAVQSGKQEAEEAPVFAILSRWCVQPGRLPEFIEALQKLSTPLEEQAGARNCKAYVAFYGAYGTVVGICEFDSIDQFTAFWGTPDGQAFEEAVAELTVPGKVEHEILMEIPLSE